MADRKVILGEGTFRRVMAATQTVEGTPTDLTGQGRRRARAAGGPDVLPARVVGFDAVNGWHLADIYGEGLAADAWNYPTVPLGSVASEEAVPLRLLGQDETLVRLAVGTLLPVVSMPWQVDAVTESQWTVVFPFTGVSPWVQLTAPHPDMDAEAMFTGDLYSSGAAVDPIAWDVTVALIGVTSTSIDVWQTADWATVPRLMASRAYRTWTPLGGAVTELVYEANGWFLLG